MSRGLESIGDDEVLEDGTAERMAAQILGTPEAEEAAEERGVVPVKLGGFHEAARDVFVPGRQTKNQPGRLDETEPGLDRVHGIAFGRKVDTHYLLWIAPPYLRRLLGESTAYLSRRGRRRNPSTLVFQIESNSKSFIQLFNLFRR